MMRWCLGWGRSSSGAELLAANSLLTADSLLSSKPRGLLRGAGFSLWGFVLARSKPRRLKPAPLSAGEALSSGAQVASAPASSSRTSFAMKSGLSRSGNG